MADSDLSWEDALHDFVGELKLNLPKSRAVTSWPGSHIYLAPLIGAPPTRKPEYIEAQRKLRLKTAFLDLNHPHPATNSVNALVAAGIKLAVAPPSSISTESTTAKFLCHDVMSHIFQFLPLVHLARVARVSKGWYFASVTILAPFTNLIMCIPHHAVVFPWNNKFSSEGKTVLGAMTTFTHHETGFNELIVFEHRHDQVVVGRLVFYWRYCFFDPNSDTCTFEVSEYRTAQEAIASKVCIPREPGPGAKTLYLEEAERQYNNFWPPKNRKEFPSSPRAYLQVMKKLVSDLGVSLSQFALCLPSVMHYCFLRSLVDASEREAATPSGE
jgi:hypothetical protein